MAEVRPITLDELFSLIPDEQVVQIVFCGLKVEGTQEALVCITNQETNDMAVVDVEAADDKVVVWLKDKSNDDVPLISMEGYK